MKRIFILLSLSLLCGISFAQTDYNTYSHADKIDQQVIPIDTALRQGVLGNGLTYYVIRNEKEKGRADFRLLVRAGSFVEKDNERGLSHFVEHMYLRGTKHFPGSNVLGFLRRHGIPFGPDNNAITGYETVNYMLNNIPTGNPQLVDSCLLLMRDIAGDMTIAKESVESERNVIVEEWRTRSTVAYSQQLIEDITNNSLYAKRSPIGDVNVVRNCSAQLVRDFYDHWYQPQNEAIVVVGDFDPDMMVSKIRTMFATMKRGKTVVPPLPDIPENEIPRIAFYQDKHIPNYSITWMSRLPEISAEEKATIGGQRKIWMRNRVLDIVNHKLDALAKRDSELLKGNAGLLPLADSEKLQFGTIAIECSTDKWKQGTEKLAMLLEHIRRQGFRQEDWRGDIYMDPSYNADTTAIVWNDSITSEIVSKPNNGTLSRELATCFFQKRQYISSKYRDPARNYIANSVTEAQLHEVFKEMVDGKNVLIATMLPEGSVIPRESEIREIFEGVKKMSDEELAVVDVEKAKRLKVIEVDTIDFAPTPGTIKKTIARKDITTEWLLSNGVKVVLIKSRYSSGMNDDHEIGIQISRPSGLSVLNDNDRPYAQMLSSCVQKYCSSRSMALFSLNAYEDNYQFNIFNPDKVPNSSYMEKFFKQMYATLTNTKVDSVALSEELSKIRMTAATVANNSNMQAQARIATLFSAAPKRLMPLLREDVARLNFDHFQEVVKDYFSNYNGAVMYIQGNFETDSIKPYILKYVASLPSKAEPVRREVWPADHFKTENTITTEKIDLPNPLCFTVLYYTWEKDFRFSKEQHALNQVFESVLRNILINKLRVQYSDVYTPTCSVQDVQYPVNKMICTVAYYCNPSQRERIVKETQQVISDMANDDLITQLLINSYIQEREKKRLKIHANSTLHDNLRNELGDIVINDNDLRDIKKVTPAALKAHIRQLLQKGNIHIGYLTTE